MLAIAYRLRSTVRSRFGATVALALVVATVCGAVLAVAAGAHRTTTAPDRFTKAFGGVPDAFVVQLQGGVPVTAEVAKLPAVESVHAYTFLFAILAPAGDASPVEALAFAGSPAGAGERLIAGRLPQPNASDEFVATTSFADTFHAKIGERFDLYAYTQAEVDAQQFGTRLPDSAPRPAVLVGIVDGPSALDDPSPYVMFSSVLLDPPTFAISQTQMAVTLRPGFDLASLRTQLDGVPGGQAMSVDKGQLISGTVRRAVSAQSQGLWIIVLVAGIAALAVLGQLISRHIRVTAADRERLSAIGFTRGQILVESLGRAAVPVVLGAVLASALAVVPSGIFPVGFVRRIEPDPGIHFDSLVVLTGALIFLLAFLAWTAAAIALDQRPAKVVRPSKLVESVAVHTSSVPAATGVRFAFTHRTGDRGSTSSPIVGMALIIGGLVASTVFGVSVIRLVDTPERYGSNYDYAVGDNGGGAMDQALADALDASPDVSGITLYGYGAARVGSATVQLVGMKPVRGGLLPELSAGRVPAGDDEIALGLVTARALGVDVGDSLTMVGASSTAVMRVTGIAIISGFGPVDGVGVGGVVTYAGLSKLDESTSLGTAAITVQHRDQGTLERVAALVGVRPGDIPTANNRPPAVANVARVRGTPFLLDALLGALAMLSVVHIMLTSLRRRRRDLAVLTALGADRGWLRRAVHWQASATIVLPIVIGVPLGIVAGRLVFSAFADSIGAADDASTPLLVLAAMAIGLLVLANIAAVPSWPRRSSRPADSLQAGR
ncbi:MAG: hypothetical protein JWL72_3856 [Ilumatobacteraceae bacterium]|nr:hypothetical protein [Ilumatobacteraceae bacterium]